MDKAGQHNSIQRIDYMKIKMEMIFIINIRIMMNNKIKSNYTSYQSIILNNV